MTRPILWRYWLAAAAVSASAWVALGLALRWVG